MRKALVECKHGHAMTPENTYTPPKRPNVRSCRECIRRRAGGRIGPLPAPCLDCGGSVGEPNGKRPPMRCAECSRARARLVSRTNMRRYRAAGKRPPKGERRWDDAQVGRFYQNVTKAPGCWEWHGTMGTSGYGMFAIKGWRLSSHRAAWELAHGPIPAGSWVLHHCDNKRCVRPEHLYLGDQLQNVHDAVVRQRIQQGSGHWRNRLPSPRDEQGRWVKAA